jgi:hypothetical protein
MVVAPLPAAIPFQRGSPSNSRADPSSRTTTRRAPRRARTSSTISARAASMATELVCTTAASA